MEACCGTTCDKLLLVKQLKTQGAEEMIAFINLVGTEDMSKTAFAEYLRLYLETLD